MMRVVVVAVVLAISSSCLGITPRDGGNVAVVNNSAETVTLVTWGGAEVDGGEFVHATIPPGERYDRHIVPEACIEAGYWAIRDTAGDEVDVRSMRSAPLCNGDVWTYDPDTTPPVSRVYIENATDMRVSVSRSEIPQDLESWSIPPGETRLIPAGPWAPGECLDDRTLEVRIPQTRMDQRPQRDFREEPLCVGETWVIERNEPTR